MKIKSPLRLIRRTTARRHPRARPWLGKALAESFFNLLKRERIRRKVYRTRAEARADVFDYIEMFYNPTRKHARNEMLSPVEFEREHKARAEGV